MKSKLLYLAILSTLLGSCFRLDDQFFNRQVITSYGLDNYTGDRELNDLPDSYNLADSMIHLFSLSSNDNGDVQTIYAIYLGELSSIATDTVIVYCHGNKYHMDLYWNRAKLLANVGGKHHYGVLMMDYRGYGMSTGSTTESGLRADVNTCVQWLKDRGLSGDRMIMYGYSLGSAPATYLSANTGALSPHKLILEAPFASAEVMVQDAALAAFPASYFTNIKLDNSETIKSVQQPLCWIHGTDDDFLQIQTHGEVVYANYQGSYKEAHRVSGGLHNNEPAVMGFENYMQVIDSYIKRQ